MFLVTRLRIVLIIAIIGAVLIGAIIALYGHPISGEGVAYKYVVALGWEVEREPIESVNVKIPAKLGEVYDAYNRLQRVAGFDLGKVRGKTCERNTFVVKNFDQEEDVRINILVYRGKVVGGDICSVKADGFMLPLESRQSTLELRKRSDE